MKATDRYSRPARLLAGVLIGLLLESVAVWAQAPTPAPAKALVGDVIIYGNRLVPAQRLKSLLKTREGTDYSQDTVNEDVRTLESSGLVGNVQVRTQPVAGGRVNVFFGVVEYPSKVQEIIFQGNKHEKPEELEKIIGVRKDAPLNPTANKLACQAIKRYYVEQGRPLAECYLVEGGNPGDTRVVFNITEGPKVSVDSIGFTGNTFVSSPVLKTHINSSSMFLHLFGGKYNAIMAEVDVAKLEEYYRSFGFHDVRISRELQLSSDQRYATLIFHIHEGPRYKLGGIEVVGAKAFSKEELEQLLKSRRGEWLNQAKLDADKTRIQDYAGYRGRDLLTRIEYFYPPDDPGVVQVQYQVQERPPAKVGNIIIVGNTVTKDRVILNALEGVYPGGDLQPPNLRLSERNLARLNIFETKPEAGERPTITVIDPDSDAQYKDIMISVKEQPTGSLIFGVGVNSDAGLTGSIVLNERNFDIFRWPTSIDDFLEGRAFRGAGQEFRAEAVPGTQVQRYSISFREPRLFDTTFGLDLGAYYYTRDFNEYHEERLGFRAGLSKRLNEKWTASVGMRLENVGVDGVLPYAPIDFQEVKGNNFLVGLRGSVARDTRDSYMRPTEGNRVEFSAEEVLGDHSYPILTLEGNQFFTLHERADGSGRHVLALRSVLSWAGSDTPVYDRFYAGGFRSMRGFEFRGISPNKFDIFGNEYKVGGDFMFLNSAEYQIPLTAGDQIQFVTFVDTGTVETDVRLDNYRVAAGFGLRFVVPMLGPVPIALDFGFPIVKANGDKQQVFSFWLGFFR
jgi:outer membrane protein assembly complex protein YaeT